MITFIIDPYIIDPLGIAYLSAMLKEGGYQPKLLLTTELHSTGIDTPIVGYSVTTGKHAYYAELNRRIKERYPSITSIFGGAHCTFFPEFACEKGVDYIFRGEGFQAIVDFCDNYVKDGALNSSRLEKTANVGYYSYEKERLIVNDLLKPMRMVDLPFPDRGLIYKYRKNMLNPIRNVMASFGCMMNCSYCYNKRYKQLGYNVRVRAVDNVIEECEQLKDRYPTELIYFQDDIFPVYQSDWLESFCGKYAKQVDVPFHIQVRVEMLNKENIRMLKESGLHGLTFAIETADNEAREELLNRRITNKEILAKADLLRRHDIKFRIENMLGIPYETVESALKTLDLNIECKPAIGWASLYQAYPGTDLGEMCHQKKLIEGKFDVDFFTSASVKLKGKKKIERLQKLFALVCAIPQLRPILPILLRLPFHYKMIYKWVKQFLYNRRLYKIGG